MKNFARISISLVVLAGFAGVATAGDGSAAKPAAPAPTKAPAPPKTPADTKATPAPADKAATPADTKAAPMAMPKPAPEIAAAFKAMGGTWRCDGIIMGGADMSTEIKTKGTMKSKMDLDGFWIVASFSETKKGGFKLVDYSSFEPTTKKWTRIMTDNMGGHEVTTSTGMNGNKMVWEGTANGMGMSMKSRHTEEVVSPKETKISGEYSMDGKSYKKMYDMTCKK